MNKRALSERDICSKFITPALVDGAKWDLQTQIREEESFTKGRVIVRGKITARGESKRADYVLYFKPGVKLAVIEAKDNRHPVGAGMQQALEYAATLKVPFAFSSNGDAFLFHDATGLSDPVEVELPLDRFPSPHELWDRYCRWKGIKPAARPVVEQDYHLAQPDKLPRYYQQAEATCPYRSRANPECVGNSGISKNRRLERLSGSGKPSRHAPLLERAARYRNLLRHG